jgi:hypothetical protein
VQDTIESREDSEDGDHPESVPRNEQSPEVDDEGPTTQSEEEKENLESGFEDKRALQEIADGLSQPPGTCTGSVFGISTA